MVIIILEVGWLGMLLEIWDSANVCGIPQILHHCYIFDMKYLILSIAIPFFYVSNARFIFSYTTNVMIVPGRTRITEATRLDVSLNWRWCTLCRILECLLCGKFFLLRLLLKYRLFLHRELVDAIEELDMDM